MLGLVFALLFAEEPIKFQLDPTGYATQKVVYGDKVKDIHVITYKVEKNGFKTGKVPERLEFQVIGPQPEDADVSKEIIVFPPRKEGWWHLDFEDVTVKFYFTDLTAEQQKEWKKIKLMVKAEYMSETSRRNALFFRDMSRIRGVVDYGNVGGFGDKYYVDIAECLPDINEIVKKVRKAADDRGVKIDAIGLKPGHDYLLKDGEVPTILKGRGFLDSYCPCWTSQVGLME